MKGPTDQLGYDYREITLDDCKRIVNLIKPPEEFTTEREREEPPTGDLGEISTSNFELDLDEFDEFLFAIFEAETSQAKGDRLEDAAEHLIEGAPIFL